MSTQVTELVRRQRPAPAGRTRLWQQPDVRFAVAAFLVGRFVLSALAVVGWTLPHFRSQPATLWSSRPPAHTWQAAFTGFERYDADWYLQLASHGYHRGDPSSAFFPLYPLLIRGVAALTGGHWLLAATLVSNLSLLVSLVLLMRLTSRELSPFLARPVVLLLLCSPMALFLYAPYSESTFLALCLGCLWLLREGRWGLAAVLGALAAATRSTGVVLAGAMAVQALQPGGWGTPVPRLRQLWRPLLLSAGPVLGMAGYLLFWQLHGSWHEPQEALRNAFDRVPTTPWHTLALGVGYVGRYLTTAQALPFTAEGALGLAALPIGVVAVRRYAPAYGVFTAASLLLPLTVIIRDRPLTSVARYDLVVFPLYWVLAQTVRRPLARWCLLAVSAVLLAVLTLLFASWHDVI